MLGAGEAASFSATPLPACTGLLLHAAPLPTQCSASPLFALLRYPCTTQVVWPPLLLAHHQPRIAGGGRASLTDPAGSRLTVRPTWKPQLARCSLLTAHCRDKRLLSPAHLTATALDTEAAFNRCSLL